ncbi:TrkH family potassium uptake protein [Streptomonospora nanhaiensis]|uniref:Potassium uptake TrkH family protein n=1 Tax=Streptomonospora nanhaiensis TaxID=1323731 RepID=A0A853BM12_9ACTN|nr:potassium transporter TrkG [Streptomonospora nanhaiensis]MBV2363258.1 TrkH family potassium uptake protein [Streptomonospora nanhaiensis]MBX9390520.1 TrkH family potassium uptake protein [Streptomonospora nanhaiensis]NYI95616.1 potassium uptake TrkH family protein [Streptomonospora nanhaiensis]
MRTPQPDRAQTVRSAVYRRLARLWRRPTLPRDIPRALWGRPARVFVLLFVVADLLGALVLLLPAAHAEGESLTVVEALFTATSALAVCGLAVIGLGSELSVFGELVVAALVQVGGIGIMTLASVLGVVVIHRFGLRMQLTVQAETRSLSVGDVSGIVGRVVRTSLLCEAVLAAVIVPRLWLSHGMSPLEVLYSGAFHSIMAFNNAGLSLYDDSLTRFSGDPVILLPIAAATIVGGLGFPVLLELRRHLRSPRRWSLHTKLTMTTTGLLFAAGIVLVPLLEWTNPATLGGLSTEARLVNGIFHGIMPRSGGFNTVDVGAMEESTLLVTIMLMFVGNGSGSTAGGIKVATLAVLFLVVWAEIRGHPHVHVFGRRLPPSVIREALSLTFLSMTVVVASTVALLVATTYPLEVVLFEVVSASGVVGLSTGITGDLPEGAQLLLVVLMLAGRIGPITFASALALREHTRRYDLAESRPIIG